MVKPFQIKINDDTLDDLYKRLEATRWTDEPAGPAWSYGTDPKFLKSLLHHWRHAYDWRKEEAKLNELQQFKAEIDGVELHFVHERGQGENPQALLLLHGWPDSFYRYHKVIPMLTKADDDGQSFDIIVPSMPGFGFSGHTAMSNDDVAKLMSKLMNELGYEHYLVAGGDLGAQVTMSMGRQFPEAVDGIHVTEVGYPTGQEDFSSMSEAEQEFAKTLQQWWYTEGAYNMLQSSKPQTLGYALNDSPAGLASWIAEKFYTWGGGNEDAFTKDELITNIMIYWVTETMNSAMRMYAENARAIYAQPGGPKPPARVTVPTAIAHMAYDAPLPREWAERQANVTRYTDIPSGHFAPLQTPELYAKDLRETAAAFKA